MLVKELRQGLRTRGFVIALIASQAILFMILLGSLTSDSPQAAGQMINGSIITVFAILTVIIQPLRGINAITHDIKSKTLELMQLTRMNSTKVVVGKWVSIYTQTLLFAVTLFPYFVLRYFFGGMDITTTAFTLMGLLLASALLSAITVGLSANKSIIIRGLFICVAGFLLLSSGFSFLIGRMMTGSVTSGGFWSSGVSSIILWVLVVAYVSFLFLELGSSVIAPISENRQTRLRLTSLAFIAVFAGICLLGGVGFPGVLAATLMVALAFMFLSSYLFVTPNTAKKFLSKGPLGSILGRFLYPGWPAGYLFFLVISILMILLSQVSSTSGLHDSSYSISFTFLGALSLSLILIELLVPKTFARFAFLMIMLISQTFILFIAFLLSTAMTSSEILLFSCVVPICQLAAIENSAIAESARMVSYVVNSVYILGAVFLACRRFGYYRELEDSVRLSLQEAPKSDD